MFFFLFFFFLYFSFSVLNDCVIQVEVLVALPIWKAIQRYEAVLDVALLVCLFSSSPISIY